MENTITVDTELGPVVVRKMPLADYAELLKAFDNIPKNLMTLFGGVDNEKLSTMDNSDFLSLLPTALATSWGDLINVVAVPTDKDAEFMGKLDLADAVDIVTAIVELNDLPRILESIKKVLALRAKIAPVKPKAT